MRMEVDVPPFDDDLELPRDTTGRNVLLVLLAALLAFGITFAAVRLRHRMSPARATPTGTVAQPPAAQPTAPPPSPLPAPAAATPAVPAPPTPTPAPGGPSPVLPVKTTPALDPAAKGLRAPVPAARKPAVKGAYQAQPPAHLKGELLPIGR